jgi:hypothetical protein
MSRALSNPTTYVDNVPVAIVPNSFKFKLGKGTVKVRAASVGGGSVESVHTEDAEAKIGMIKFSLYVTGDNIASVNTWKSSATIGGHVVQGIDSVTNKPIVLQSASMVNDPDFEASADGKVEVEFEGNPIANNF